MAANAAGTAAADSALTAAVAAAAPTNSAVPAITGTAKEGQLLTASTGTWAGTAPITFAYQWQSCSGSTCTAISGATASTFRLTSAQVSKTIKIVVTATNTGGTASATSAATASVTTGAPVNVALPAMSGTPALGQLLTVVNGTWAGTATITFTVQWNRCNSTGGSCTSISGATAATYTLASADVGSTVRAIVTAHNSVGTATANSNLSAVVAGSPPANTALPTIAPSTGLVDTQFLSATNGTWTPTSGLTFTRQWKRCDGLGAGCVPIAGATATSYITTGADVGSTIVVAVTATNSAGSATATSAATGTVAPLPVNNLASPTITGTAADGHLLSSSPGTWIGTTPVSLTYQWQHCNSAGNGCTPVAGATGTSYSLTTADVGFTIRVAITGTNVVRSFTAGSDQTAVVAALPPVNTGAPQIGGGQYDGDTVTAQPGFWSSTAPLTYSYQWRRCDAAGANCADIPGETQSQYQTTADDLDHTLVVVVTATNTGNNVSATSRASNVFVVPPGGLGPSGVVPVATPLDPLAADHMAETSAIFHAIFQGSTATGPGCDQACSDAAQDYFAMLAEVDQQTPAQQLAGRATPMTLSAANTPNPVKQAIVDNVKRIMTQMSVDLFELQPLSLSAEPTQMWALITSPLTNHPEQHRVAMRLELPAAVDQPAGVCGAPPPVGSVCSVNEQILEHVRVGDPLLGTETAQANGFLYEYNYTPGSGPEYAKFQTDIAADCPDGTQNYFGLAEHAPADATPYRATDGGTVPCGDGVSVAITGYGVTKNAILPPNSVIKEVAPYTDQPVEVFGQAAIDASDDITHAIGEPDDPTKKWLAHSEDPNCNRNPADPTGTIVIPKIQRGESGTDYANCIATLGDSDVTVSARADDDIDITQPPGTALEVSPIAGAAIDPSTPITVIMNPKLIGTALEIAQGILLRNQAPNGDEGGFNLVASLIAQECVELSARTQEDEATPPNRKVDIKDCGDLQTPGLPMFVSGGEVLTATMHDMTALGLNPEDQDPPGQPVTQHAQWFKQTWRIPQPPRSSPAWYTSVPETGYTGNGLDRDDRNLLAKCKGTDADKTDCDEFPPHATLQGGEFTPDRDQPTVHPHVRIIDRFDNRSQGSKLKNFAKTCGVSWREPPGTPPEIVDTANHDFLWFVIPVPDLAPTHDNPDGIPGIQTITTLCNGYGPPDLFVPPPPGDSDDPDTPETEDG